MANLTIKSGGTQERVALQGAKVVVGRGVESQIKLKDIKVSKAHFAIVKSPTGFVLQDLTSGNGTIVNGQTVQNSRPLKTGDVIQVGDTTIVFTADGQTAAAKPPTAAMKPPTGSTRPVTARMPASSTAKPTRPAPAPTEIQMRPPTRAMAAAPKAGHKATSRVGPALKPTTARRGTPGGRLRAGKLGGMERSMRVPKNKKLPLIIGGVVVLLVIVVAVIAGSSGGGGTKKLLEGATSVVGQGEGLLAQGDYDGARAKFQQALDLADKVGKDGTSVRARAEAGLKEITDRQGKVAAMAGEWKKLDDEYKAGGYDPDSLMRRCAEFGVKAVAMNLPIVPEITARCEGLQREVNTLAEIKRNTGFTDFKRSQVDPLVKENKFAAAIAKLEEFLKTAKADDAGKASAHMGNVSGNFANSFWLEIVLPKARGLCNKGQIKEAIDYLKSVAPDFEKTQVADTPNGIKALIKWLEDKKSIKDFK